MRWESDRGQGGGRRLDLAPGAIPIVISQNSPCGSFAIAKCVSEATEGKVGTISLDTHWDIAPLDKLTMDPRIAGSDSWLYKTYEFLGHCQSKILNT